MYQFLKIILVLEERTNGLNKIKNQTLGWLQKIITYHLPKKTYTAEVFANPDFDTDMIKIFLQFNDNSKFCN